MSRQQFAARNNIGSVLTFQKSGATASFDPQVSFSSGSRRVSWKLDNGTNITQTAGNSITYTGFTSDPGIRTIQMKGNSFRDINFFRLDNDNLYGHLDLTQLSELSNFFRVDGNINLTSITHAPSSQNFLQYQANNCKLTGNLDLTPLSGLGGSFQVYSNINLTGITHAPSSQNFSQYLANNCNLTGNLDLTPLSGLGGVFWLYTNPKLTGITHTQSSQIFSNYYAQSCNLIGILDLTPLSGLGGDIRITSNTGLTNVNFTISTQNITALALDGCDITGEIDLSPLTKLGASSSGVTFSWVSLHTNPNLTSVIFPNTNQFFKNGVGGAEAVSVFRLYGCNLDYVDFKPLSGATLVSGTTQGMPRISLRDNNMSAANVNHILVDFSGNTTYNPTGWSNVNLNIGGTNDPPNSTSGGYDGLAAISFLTGSPYNWIITT